MKLKDLPIGTEFHDPKSDLPFTIVQRDFVTGSGESDILAECRDGGFYTISSMGGMGEQRPFSLGDRFRFSSEYEVEEYDYNFNEDFHILLRAYINAEPAHVRRLLDALKTKALSQTRDATMSELYDYENPANSAN